MDRPRFIFDDECAFCCFWVDRWKRHVGEAVAFESITEHLASHPPISEAVLRRASHLRLPDGTYLSGAKGVAYLLSYGSGMFPWKVVYERIPLVAWLAERLYALVSSCRVCAWEFTKWIFPSARKASVQKK